MINGQTHRTRVPAALLDTVGLLALGAAALFLSAACYTEDHMGMGVYMGLFIGSVVGAILLFGSSRLGIGPLRGRLGAATADD